MNSKEMCRLLADNEQFQVDIRFHVYVLFPVPFVESSSQKGNTKERRREEKDASIDFCFLLERMTSN
jgi:hypothetical protein